VVVAVVVAVPVARIAADHRAAKMARRALLIVLQQRQPSTTTTRDTQANQSIDRSIKLLALHLRSQRRTANAYIRFSLLFLVGALFLLRASTTTDQPPSLSLWAAISWLDNSSQHTSNARSLALPYWGHFQPTHAAESTQEGPHAGGRRELAQRRSKQTNNATKERKSESERELPSLVRATALSAFFARPQGRCGFLLSSALLSGALEDVAVSACLRLFRWQRYYAHSLLRSFHFIPWSRHVEGRKAGSR